MARTLTLPLVYHDDSMADDLEMLGDGNDTDAMRRLMRDMGSELGEDLEQDFDAVMDEETAPSYESFE